MKNLRVKSVEGILSAARNFGYETVTIELLMLAGKEAVSYEEVVGYNRYRFYVEGKKEQCDLHKNFLDIE